MCGICGAVSTQSVPPLNEARLTLMRDSLRHRGPDDAGNYMAPGVALASRRLSILDLSPNGHMPMSTEDGRYWIVYNGEVYNFENLRQELILRGVKFRSKTDTEVILKLFALEGPGMLNRLNGMFAIAVWDSKERSLFLARDRMGVKPLYYFSDSERFYFASEEKAFSALGLTLELDPSNFEELLYFHYVAGEKTPYKKVFRLLPGHYLLWREGKFRVSQWWNLEQRAKHAEAEVLKNPAEWFQKTFDDAVRLRRISDVPVGVFLSGGLDSGSVAAAMALQESGEVSGFTVRFEEAAYDEGPLAGEIASRYHLNQHGLRVSSDQLSAHLQQATYYLDAPMVHASDIHLWMLSKEAKPKVSVLLSGEGADETLAGYGWFLNFRRLPFLRKCKGLFGALGIRKMHPRLEKLNQFLSLSRDYQMMLRNASEVLRASCFGFAPLKGRFEFREKILREAEALYPQEPARQAMYYDQHTYLCSILDRNDRMTMAASIECRTPFLDFRLVEGLAALPSKDLFHGIQNKWLLRRSLGKRLPASVLRQRKKGFEVPWHLYFRKNAALRDRVLKLPAHPFWEAIETDRKKMKNAITEFMNGKDEDTSLIRHLLMLAVWYDTCIEKQNPERFLA